MNKTSFFTFVLSSFLFVTLFLSPFTALAQNPKPIGPIDGLDTPWDVSGTDINSYSTKLENVLSLVVGFLTIIGGLYFLIQFLIGGLGWISAGGDKQKIEDAKSRITNAAIGLIVIVAAYSIVFIVGKILGIDILNPAKVIENLNPPEVTTPVYNDSGAGRPR